jgi:SSS family solute:Na+ symporter
MIAYVSSQFVAGGKAFSASFDISQTQGILISAAIILLYTLTGGFLAVSMTDVVQGFFMLFSLVLVPMLAVWHAGGWEFIHADLLRQRPDFFNPFSIALGSILGFVGIGLAVRILWCVIWRLKMQIRSKPLQLLVLFGILSWR